MRWFEEPVSSDDLDGLRQVRERAPPTMEIAAGEYGYTLDYFRRMLEAGAVDVQQADATRCGGVTGFMQAAALCEAHHVDLSAHCAPALHRHLGCAAPRFRHLEWFHDHVRIEQMLFDGAPEPHDGADRARPVASRARPHIQAEGRRAVRRSRRDGRVNRDATTAVMSGVALLCLAALSSRRRSAVALARSAPVAKIDRDLAARPTPVAKLDPTAAVRAARRMNRAAGLIATSVLADSAIEHYRGLFHNKAMVTPIVTAALSLAVSAHGSADTRPAAHRMRDAVYAAAALAGIAGLGFHVYNVSKRPGRIFLAESVLLGADRRASGAGPVRRDGISCRSGCATRRLATPRRSAAFRRGASSPPQRAPA